MSQELNSALKGQENGVPVGSFEELLRYFLEEMNMPDLSLKHIEFLKGIHPFTVEPVSLESLEHSLYRYVSLWLPLLKEESDSGDLLVPPVDVAFFWHAHRLAPRWYLHSCCSLFDKSVDKSTHDDRLNILKTFERPESFLTFSTDANDADCNVRSSALKTKRIWEKRYESEPYWIENNQGPISKERRMKKVHGYDLISSVKSQRLFLWQVSRNCFSDTAFLTEATKDYVKFLKLISRASNKFTVPRYDIDLIWHTHMTVSPYLYHLHCFLTTGILVDHDDSDASEERTKESRLSHGFADSKRRWRNLYNEEYVQKERAHTYCYRGNPPPEYFRKDWVAKESPQEQFLFPSMRPIVMMLNGVDSQHRDGPKDKTGMPFYFESSSDDPVLRRLMVEPGGDYFVDEYNKYYYVEPESQNPRALVKFYIDPEKRKHGDVTDYDNISEFSPFTRSMMLYCLPLTCVFLPCILYVEFFFHTQLSWGDIYRREAMLEMDHGEAALCGTKSVPFRVTGNQENGFNITHYDPSSYTRGGGGGGGGCGGGCGGGGCGG